MSPRNSKQKPSAGNSGTPTVDVYFGLLLVAVGALALGCWMLANELARYGWQPPT